MKYLLLLILTLGLLPALPAEEAEKKPEPPPRRERGERGFWRAFSMMDETERAQMLKLQTSDPEKFRTIMREKAEALRKVEEERRQNLAKLIADWKASTDEKVKSEIKQKLTEHVRQDFQRRLSENRRQLDEMRTRTKRLEEEISKREQNAEQIVEIMVDDALAGKVPPPPPRPPQR